MAKVFGGSVDTPTVVKAGKAIITVNNQELIALNVSIQYSRQVDIVPALSSKRIVSIGEPQGTFSCETLVAKSIDAVSAFKLDGDDCSPFNMQIRVKDGSCDTGTKTITAHNCFSSAVSLTAQGGRGYIAEGIQVTFTGLEGI